MRLLSICGALDHADLLELERIGRSVHLAPNEALFTAGQSAGSVYNLTAGVARLYKLLPDGRRQILGFGLSATHLSQATADLVFLGDRLSPVVISIELSRKALRLMRQNL